MTHPVRRLSTSSHLKITLSYCTTDQKPHLTLAKPLTTSDFGRLLCVYHKWVVASLWNTHRERKKRRCPFPMPESSADTFWGKGFLATALGTASPDRKKTHKGQKNLTLSSWCDLLGIYRKKKSHQQIWCMQRLSEAGSDQYGWKLLDTGSTIFHELIRP